MVQANQKVGACVQRHLLFCCYCLFASPSLPNPVGKVLLDIFIILMFYDFFYYLAHRFWFHGNGAMRKIHAVHHQARNPTYLDAHYVHPMRNFRGPCAVHGLDHSTCAVHGSVSSGHHRDDIL